MAEPTKVGIMNTLNQLIDSHRGLPGAFSGLLRFNYLHAAGKMPGDKDVLRELHKIIRKDFVFKEPTRPMTLNIDWLDSALKNIAQVLRDPLLIVLGIAVLTGLYFLIRAIAPYVHGKPLQRQTTAQLPQREKAPLPDHFQAFYRLALDQSQAGQYRQALISLHKATVEYLLAKVIITAPHKKYTNNDLRRKLSGNQTLYHPFCIITTYAEIAGFSTMEVTPADFNRVLETFESVFL
jgi:cation transport regulator ChaB